MVLEHFTLGGAFDALKLLIPFVIGMAIYGIFVFKFYKFLAKREIFEIDLQKYNKSEHPTISKFFSIVLYIIEYVLLFPVFTFFWFAVITLLLMFLAKEQAVSNILLISIALVGAVRITAYYNEELSKDFAKMLPFALLGVFLIDVRYFAFIDSFIALKEIPALWVTLAYYLIFVIVLEFVLRIGYLAVKPFLKEEKSEK